MTEMNHVQEASRERVSFRFPKFGVSFWEPLSWPDRTHIKNIMPLQQGQKLRIACAPYPPPRCYHYTPRLPLNCWKKLRGNLEGGGAIAGRSQGARVTAKANKWEHGVQWNRANSCPSCPDRIMKRDG